MQQLLDQLKEILGDADMELSDLAEALLQNADAALYQAKDSGRNAVAVA